jgi:hypothetical protein
MVLTATLLATGPHPLEAADDSGDRVEFVQGGDWLQGVVSTPHGEIYFESEAEVGGRESDSRLFSRIRSENEIIAEVLITQGGLSVDIKGLHLSGDQVLMAEDYRIFQRFVASPEAESVRSLVSELLAQNPPLDRRIVGALAVISMAIGDDSLGTGTKSPPGSDLYPVDWCPGPDHIPNCTNPATDCLGCCGNGCAGCLNCCTFECLEHDTCCRTLGCGHPHCILLFPAAANSVWRCLFPQPLPSNS